MRLTFFIILLFWGSGHTSPFTGLERFGNLSSRGIVWGDFNNDTQPDVVISNIEEDRLYQYTGGDNFSLSFSFAPDTSWGVGLADLDNNGYLDLLVISRDTLRIYKNEGGRFTDSLFYVIPGARSLAFGDYDNNGYLDIAVACIGQNRLLKNRKDFKFDMESEFGEDSSYSISWADFNRDGLLDIAVANLDKGVKVYKNVGGYFTELDINSYPGSHSIAWGDWNNDGWPDLAVGYLGDANRLYNNDSGSSFSEKSNAFGISPDSTISISWVDYDNDGYLDLVASNFGEPNKLYRNHSGYWFESPTQPFDVADSSYGMAWADYDGDGDLDLAVANEGKNKLYKNNLSGKKHIKLRLRGRGEPYSNSYGIGAKLILFNAYNNSLVGYREMRAGAGFCSQDAPEVIFGTPGELYNIVILWPSGIVDSLKGLSPNYENTIYEDSRPPQNPTKVWSSHKENGWSKNPVIEMEWNSATDLLGSGVMGYSFLFDQNLLTNPDTIIDNYQPDTNTQSEPLSEGIWYFHLKAVDSVGNWAVGSLHKGPYKIDFTPPSPPSLISPPNGLYTNQQRIEFYWHPGRDTLSGVDHYKIQIATDSNFRDVETHTPSDTSFSMTLPPETLYWRVRTVDSAQNESEWSEVYSLTIDTTHPSVVSTIPRDNQQDISPNAKIRVKFSEPIDSLTINSNSFVVKDMATDTPILPDSIRFDGRYWVFYPHGLLPQDAWICCYLTEKIKDFAGNGLVSYDWTFKTGKAEDSIPPIISEAEANPNPTMGADTLIIEATAQDTGEAKSNVVKVEYFIDSIEGEGHVMRPKDGSYDSPVEEVVDTLLTENLLPGIRRLFIRAQDGSGNLGSPYVLVVNVIKDTTLTLSINPEKDSIYAGDTLSVKVEAKDKKGKPRVLKDIYLYVKMDDKTEDMASITTRDSILFTAKYIPSGVYTGRVWIVGWAVDKVSNSARDSVPLFILPALDPMPEKGVYAWPNPATTDNIHFHYTLRANADTVRLSIYTLDGKLLHREEKGRVMVDKAEDFIVDLTDFFNGIYLFKIDAKFKDKTKRVVKKFAVVR